MGRKFEQKRNAKWAKKKAKLVKALTENDERFYILLTSGCDS